MKKVNKGYGGYGGYSGGYGGYGEYGNYGGGYGSGGGYYYGDSYPGYGERGSNNTATRSIKDYLILFRERFWWLVLSIFIIFTATVIHTIQAPRIYQSVSMIQLLRKQEKSVQFEEVVDLNIKDQEELTTQIKIIESSNIIKRVADRLTDEEKRIFFAPYEDAISFTGPLTPEIVLAKNRSITPIRSSLMVAITFMHPDRELAAKIANFFVEEYINYNLNLRIEGSMRAVEELKVRADQQRKKVEEIEMQLADFKEKNKSVSFEKRSDIDTQALIQLNTALTSDKQILDEIETQWVMIQRFRDEGTPLWDLGFIANTTHVSRLLSQHSGYQIQISQLSKQYKERHPKMIVAVKGISETKNELQKAVEYSAEKIYTDYIRAQKNYQNTNIRITDKKNEIIAFAKIQVEYNSMLRNLTVAKDMFGYLYSRMQQTMTQASDEAESARIVDRAYPSLTPFKPNVFKNLVFGLMLGFGVGIGLVALLSYLDDKVKSAYDIETTIGLPLIGLIPRIKIRDSSDKARIVVTHRDKHAIEAFRSIHSALNLNKESRSAKVIMTNSTVPNEGKSFVSTNISFTYANHGEKTIIVDCDLRLPNVAKSLQVDVKHGLIDHIENDIPLEDAIIKDMFPNLDILAAGGRAKNPTQIISSEKFVNLIHELRMRYDKIIIDTPPLSPVSDALNILPLVDGVIFVIRFNAVKRTTAKVNVRRLLDSDIPVFGAVLNNISTVVAGYYSHYYYDRSYRDYYIQTPSDEQDKDNFDLEGIDTKEKEKELT